jgi:hypothetical protein
MTTTTKETNETVMVMSVTTAYGWCFLVFFSFVVGQAAKEVADKFLLCGSQNWYRCVNISITSQSDCLLGPPTAA